MPYVADALFTAPEAPPPLTESRRCALRQVDQGRVSASPRTGRPTLYFVDQHRRVDRRAFEWLRAEHLVELDEQQEPSASVRVAAVRITEAGRRRLVRGRTR